LSATLGITNLIAQPGIRRTVPLIFSYRGQVVPSFVLQAVVLWFKLTPDDVKVFLGSHIQVGDIVKIPIDAAGNMPVDYRAPIPRFGWDDLLLAAQQVEQKLKPIAPPDALKTKVVLLARTDAPSRTLRLPLARNGSPGELFACAIATIQNKSFIRRAPVYADFLTILAMMGFAFFATRLKRGDAALAAILMLIGYLFVCMTIFGFWLVEMPLVMPAGLLVFVIAYRALLIHDGQPRSRRNR
jgi:hypothetical protein